MTNTLDRILEKIDFERIGKHPNILIAARFWDDRRFNAAKTCYKFMRMIDDYIDDRKATGEKISCLEKEELSEKVYSWIECLDGANGNDPFYSELTRTISTFKIPLQYFHTFAKSMLFDINNNGFSTLNEFLDYAEGASVAPASVFVHLCCLEEADDGYMVPDIDIVRVARPCALFSYLVHIIRDFQKDQFDNLNYFAADILMENQLDPADLKEIAHSGSVPDSFRRVIRTYYDHARKYEIRTRETLQKIAAMLDGQNLMSLHVIYNLYKMVFDRIDIEHGDFSGRELNPAPREIKDKVFEIVSSWH